jgi:hypothetical protein
MLRWKGGICPCLEKPEDKGARLALELLSGLQVKWFRTGRDAKSLGGMMSGWFGGSGSSGSGSNKNDKDAVDAVLEWVDSEKGPEMQIKPQQTASTGADGEISLQKQSAGYIKTIKLEQLDKILIQEVLYLVLQFEKEAGKTQDLVTLQSVLGDASEVKEALTQLIEWDGRRRAEIPEEEREMEEMTMKDKAKQAAHFAKREIELQTQRRDREKRKAALVKETGGLKYTALAMANRMDD